MDQETVKISALIAIFDLLHFFGLEAFKLQMTEDDKTVGPEAPVQDADGSDQVEDFDDVLSENSSQPAQQQETTDIGADILTILTDLLDSNVRQVVSYMSLKSTVLSVYAMKSRPAGNFWHIGWHLLVAIVLL